MENVRVIIIIIVGYNIIIYNNKNIIIYHIFKIGITKAQ